MIHVALCDDDELFLSHMKHLFDEVIKEIPDRIEVHTFTSAESMLKKHKLIKQLDLLFIDNFMPGRNGMETARIIRHDNEKVKIIFLSSSADFVFDAFDINATKYLLKQKVDDHQLKDIVEDIILTIQENQDKKTYMCRQNNRQVMIRVDDIIAFEIVLRKTIIHTIHGTYTNYEGIKKIEEEFTPKGFVRINRSCMVNLRYVVKIGNMVVSMKNGKEFQIPYKKIAEFKVLFQEFLQNNTIEMY